LAANLLHYEVLDSQRDLVSTDRLQNNHLLEACQFVVPFSGQGLILRGLGVEDLLELGLILNKEFLEAI